MRDAKNIAEVAALPIDYMGFIFYKKSARCVTDIIYPDSVLNLVKVNNIKKVGVFVNENIENISSKVVDYQLDVVQLHGNETNDFIQSIRILYNRKGLPLRVIKSVPIFEKNDFEKIYDYPDADFLLLDTKTPLHGGSGQKFDWNLLNGVAFPKPFFLSGGIDLDDAETINNLNINNLYGIDVNSKFEIRAALKDVEMVERFVRAIR